METDLLLNQVQKMLSNMSNDIYNMAEDGFATTRIGSSVPMDNLAIHAGAGDAGNYGRS